jgi:integrase
MREDFMGNPTYTLYKRVQLSAGKWRYRKAAFHSNGKIKPHCVIVGGKEEKHEGHYFLAHDGKWIPAGNDPLEAQRKRAEYLTRANYPRLHSESNVLSFAAPQRERKSIQSEADAYISDLKLSRRPDKSVKDKRRFLLDFAETVKATHVDELTRADMLMFRNAKLAEYAPKSVNTMMMAVSTFLKQRCEVNLKMQASDWPDYDPAPPEPYIDEEIIAMEQCTTGKLNLLIRLFRSTGCRLQEITHLYSHDINVRTKEIIIRQKPCDFCRNCISLGNVWKPKTKESTRSIPISDSLLRELLALPKGLLFPDEHGRVEGHLLRKLQDAVQESGVEKVKMHRFRDTFATNKIRDHEDIRTVQKWLGHKDVNETMRYSAWLDGQSKGARDAANREDTRYKTGTHGD